MNDNEKLFKLAVVSKVRPMKLLNPFIHLFIHSCFSIQPAKFEEIIFK